ncbi:MAG: rRNA maturation RNase YbeY [Sphingobacteriales bacterium]|nr:rRNA maturation RNase YbeY [Sphingobacteriales bacterium]
MPIAFYTEPPLEFKLRPQNFYAAWLRYLIKKHEAVAGNIHLVFCTDAYLLELNRQYLQHDYYTDIITFDYTQNGKIAGDLFISVERVRDNADTLQVTFDQELARVMAHGVLHLLGFSDKDAAQSAEMRRQEDTALQYLQEVR